VLAGRRFETNDERTPVFEAKHSKRDSQQVPAAPVRAHVEELVAAGYTPTLIAGLAGVDTRRVTVLLANRTERGTKRLDADGRHEHRIYRRIAEPLLAIPIPEGLFVTATGPVRRLRALVRIGYAFDDLAPATGYDETLLAELALGNPEVIDTELASALAEVFGRYHLTPGPSDEARELGRRHRFAAPLAWALDDDDEDAGAIDDPAATPVGLPPSDDRAWRRVPPEFGEIVADHRDLGHYDEEIAAAMGVTLNTFAKRLHRAGLRERRRGDGNHVATQPIYGARYSIRLPHAMARPMAGVAS
jgi:hypothetical protein